MSDKPSPKPSASKSAGKTAGNGTTAGTKAKLQLESAESFDFLAPALVPGDLGRLAHYRVLKVLGKGGMGIVFMAEDGKLHRMVALKVMLPTIAKKEIARDRFLREARATAAIEHDHIVTIYEVSGEDSEVPYLAMQFLKGFTLEDYLKAGKTLNVPQIMRIAKEIAKGLAAAHTRQLIHRDIKPSNVWLDAANKGRVKILDFGLARPTNEETHLTQEGMILGSPAYMSPEQARGQNVDERCDLFSLGCVLYRLCSGKLPFMGKDAMSMLLAITSEEPPALVPLHAELPAALSALVHQLLAKKAEDRPASAKQVVQTIQNIERDWVANASTSAFLPVRDTSATPGAQDETVAADNIHQMDPALEESAITDLELQDTDIPDAVLPTRPAPGRSKAGSWLFAGLGCSLLAVLTLLCCLAIAFFTNHGQVQLSPEDEAARAWLEANGLIVQDHNHKAHALKIGDPQRLPAGGYEVELDKLPKGVRIEPSKFTLHRGDDVTLKVTFASLFELVTKERAKPLQREWADYLKCSVEEKTSLGSKLMLIPPGEFIMGTSEARLKAHLSDFFKRPKDILFLGNYKNRIMNESPSHRVRISKAVYVGAHEVTFGEFRKFVAANGYTSTGKGGTGLEAGKEVPRDLRFNWLQFGVSYIPDEEHPVSNITWKDAEMFCKWLSKTEGKVYRLPTEAEWEYACRAGSTSLWSFGDEAPAAFKYMWHFVPGKVAFNPITPKLVGRKIANEFGLYDMHGNVAEMCSDTFEAAYYQRFAKDKLTIDPKGPAGNSSRVLRGGSFLDTAYAARSAYRQAQDPGLPHANIGFRIVCEAPPAPE